MQTMRTMHTLKSNVQEKVDYYEEDESLIDAQERYYGEAESVSEIDRMTHARWAGSASKSEGITGAIKRDDFKTVLRGNLPTTNERIRWENPNPENKERLAHDVVLSAPKSISMALHLEGDVRVFDAHMEAVLETLDFIEKEVAQTRIQVNGVRSVVHTGNLLAALIPHHTSRDGDMQLHIHMLIMNGTKGPDGVWRSLSHESLASAEWVGSYYRQKLAQKVQRLGYRIYTTKDGFELEGYSRDEIEVFSKRNRAIVREVMSKGLEVNPENKKDAVLTTRKAKRGVGQKLEEVQEQWRAEAQLERVGRPILDRPLPVRGSLAKGKQEIDSAIRHLSETSVSFSRSDIYAYAFKHIHIKGLEIEHLSEAIAQRNDLIAVGNGRMTTVGALEREIETIQKWNLGQGKALAFMDAEAASEALTGSSLNSGQYEAVVKIVSATDRHLIIQGLSGVGKTHALGALKRLIEASGQDIEIKGYSPTIKAAQQLQDTLGIETNTVEHLVRREAQTTPNQLWIVDEAGMVSADQMLTIANKAEAVGARILLVGDTGQNPSVKAGSPMKSLMYNGATTFRLSEIIRQQNSMQRRAVELIANGRPVDALRVLNEHGYVEEVQSQSERVQAIAQEYLSLDLTERSKTLIVTGTNTERQAITKTIREGLKSEGSLGQETTTLQLANQYMSAEEKRRVENFEPGSYIQLLQDYKTTPLVKNKLYQVMGRVGHELLVSSEGGRLYHFDPSQYGDKEVFKTEQFAVAIGDRLRWTTSNRKAGQINGAEFTVIGMSEGQIIVADKKGTQIINLNQPLGVDYALVSTSYRAQGQTAKRVIVSATNGPTAAKEPFYVKISRQTHEIKVYAEDIDSLRDWVQRSIAQENALELIGDNHGINRHTEPFTSDRSVESKLPDLSDAAADHYSAEQGTANERQGALEYHPAGDEADPQRLYVATDRDYGRSEVGQDARSHQTTHQNDGQLDREIGGQQHGAVTGQSTSDGRLRRNHGGQDRYTQQNATASESVPEGTGQQWLETLNRFAQAVQSVNWDKSLVENGLNEKLSALDERIEDFSTGHVQLEFRGLSQLAERLEGRQSLQSLSENLTQLQSSLSRLDEVLEQTARRAQLDAVDTAIQQWRAEQSISEAVLEQRFEDAFQASISLDDMRPEMERLAQAIAEWKSEQQLIQVVEQLSGRITRQSQEPSFEQLTQLAELIQTNRSQQTILNSAITDKLTRLASELEDRIAQPQQGFERLDKLATALQNLQTNAVLIENGFEQKLESLSDRVNQFAQQSPEFAKLDTLGAAILEHQSQQAFSNQFEKLSELDNLLERQQLLSDLSGLILQRNDEKTFIENGFERFDALSNRLIQLNSQTQEYRFNGFIELATAINKRRAEQAINENLETFNRATAQFQAQLQAHPKLNQLADTVRSLRDNPTIAEGAAAEQLQQIAKTLRENGLSTTPKPSVQPKPQKLDVFWKPNYDRVECPGTLESGHWEEFKHSAIHPDLIALNAQSLSGQEVFERLLSERLAQLGSGQYVTQPMARLMTQYEQVAQGGWWGKAGIDAKSLVNLAPGQQPQFSTWGCLKADNPRIDRDKSDRTGEPAYIKYENPAGTKRHLYLPIVPDNLAQKIYDKHGVQPTEEERESGFWSVIVNHPEMPIVVTEGFKKTLASLSQGEVTIGFAGVNALYRARDEHKEKLSERLLNDEVAIFATPERNIIFAFDQDTKTSTIFNVRREMVRGIELLEAQGCHCTIAKWKDRKGLDDLIASQGPQAYAKAIKDAHSPDKDKNAHYRGEYNAIAHQIKNDTPDLPDQYLDVEVYLRAIAKGELKDGDRFLGQSDQARTLKDSERVKAYIEQVKASVPDYLQQQREIAVIRAQQVQDRAEYKALVEKVKQELGNITGENLDIEVLRKSGVYSDRILAQSDHARSLSDPTQVKQYIKHIKNEELKEQEKQVYGQYYRAMASGIQRAQGTLTPYRLDLEILFKAKQGRGIDDFNQFMSNSEVAQKMVQTDPKKAQRYVKALQDLEEQYRSLRANPSHHFVDRKITELISKKLIDTEQNNEQSIKPKNIQSLTEEELRKKRMIEQEWEL